MKTVKIDGYGHTPGEVNSKVNKLKQPEMKAVWVKNQEKAEDLVLDQTTGFNAIYDGNSTFGDAGYYIIKDGNLDNSPTNDLVFYDSRKAYGWLSLTPSEVEALLQ